MGIQNNRHGKQVSKQKCMQTDLIIKFNEILYQNAKPFSFTNHNFGILLCFLLVSSNEFRCSVN